VARLLAVRCGHSGRAARQARRIVRLCCDGPMAGRWADQLMDARGQILDRWPADGGPQITLTHSATSESKVAIRPGRRDALKSLF
jgi:hypothetical protein